MPDASVHAGRVDTYQNLALSDLGLVDVSQF
jgi:hypothetical protein